MSNFRCRFSLGNDLYVEMNEWKGGGGCGLISEKEDKPTKKGISLILMRCKNWVHQLEYADAALQEKKFYGHHIGGNVYCNVAENGVCVDIKQYWKPQEELVPHQKGDLFETFGVRSLERTVTRDRKRITGIECGGTMFPLRVIT